jgi:methyl-accepting chemotaxis protein
MQKRRQYYLPGTEQPALLSTLFWIWLGTAFVAGLVLYLGASQTLREATYQAHFTSLRRTGQLFLPYLLAGNLVAALGVLILGLFYTHRVAGPIYQIQKRLGRLGEGDLDVTFAVRKGDHFHSLTRSLNDATGVLRDRIVRARAAASKLQDLGPSPGARQADWDAAMHELLETLAERKH